jgi:hypothetical protein
MEIMSYINRLRAHRLSRAAADLTAEEKLRLDEELHSVETRLANLEQKMDPIYTSQLQHEDRIMILSTAELYRLATLLYLLRAHTTTQLHEHKTLYLEQAFEVLKTLRVCTSPWPLFVLACEADRDDQRIEVLQALERMDTERHIGNIRVLRDIIETFWKQQDLQADTGRSPNTKWWEVIDLNMATPWFI